VGRFQQAVHPGGGGLGWKDLLNQSQPSMLLRGFPLIFRLLTFAALLVFFCGCISTTRPNDLSQDELNDLEDRVRALEEQGPEARLDALESEVAGLAGGADALEASVANQAAAVANNLATLDELGLALSSLEEVVQALGTQSSGNEEAIFDMDAVIATNTVAISDNSSAISSNSSGISSNASAISAVNLDLANLDDELDANIPVRTRIVYNGETSSDSSNGAFVELRQLGTFTKVEASTDIILTWVSHVRQTSGVFCNFQPRIGGTAGANSYGAVISALDVNFPVSVTQSYSGLSAGNHTVSLWYRGFGNDCMDNPGSYPREVFIEEGPAN
jgi:hypothetical protein